MEKSNKKTLITESTRIKLEKQILATIQQTTILVDNVRSSITTIENLKVLLTPQNPEEIISEKDGELFHLKRLGEYTLLVGLIYLDISTAFRIYLNAKENYEVIYSTKQLVIIINEGYKKIYNYVTIENGIPKLKKRNQSFWVKDIGILLSTELPKLLPRYGELTKELDDYDNKELQDMHRPRNLSVHYDDNASDVYDMLIELDIETLATKALHFIAILNNMFLFSHEILNQYNLIINARKEDNVQFHLNKLETLKSNNPEATDLLNMMQNLVKNLGSK